MFSPAHRAQLGAHALDFGQELVVDDEQARARVVHHARERLAAQARVDAEERRAADRAAAVRETSSRWFSSSIATCGGRFSSRAPSLRSTKCAMRVDSSRNWR